MKVFAVNCMSNWYDMSSNEFLGVYSTFDKAKGECKLHLKDSSRECIATKNTNNNIQFRCCLDIIEVELDGLIVKSHYYDNLKGVEYDF